MERFIEERGRSSLAVSPPETDRERFRHSLGDIDQHRCGLWRALLGSGLTEQREPARQLIGANRPIPQVHRHEVPPVVAARKPRRRQPELDYALDVGIPLPANGVLEYGTQYGITPDLDVKCDHHVPDEFSREAGFPRAILEGQRGVHKKFDFRDWDVTVLAFTSAVVFEFFTAGPVTDLTGIKARLSWVERYSRRIPRSVS